MLTLYYRPTCAYCQSVLGEAEALSIKMTLKDISADPTLEAELLARGGKIQVPYLIDTQRGEKIFDSHNIIPYLNTHYSQASVNHSFGGLKIHQSEEVCETCQ